MRSITLKIGYVYLAIKITVHSILQGLQSVCSPPSYYYIWSFDVSQHRCSTHYFEKLYLNWFIPLFLSLLLLHKQGPHIQTYQKNNNPLIKKKKKKAKKKKVGHRAIYTSNLRLLYSQMLNTNDWPPFWAQPPLEACSASPLRHLCVSTPLLSSTFSHTGSTSQDSRQPVDSRWKTKAAYPAPVKSSTN